MTEVLDLTLRQIIDELRRDPVRNRNAVTVPNAETLEFLTEDAAAAELGFMVNTERPRLRERVERLADRITRAVSRGRLGFR